LCAPPAARVTAPPIATQTIAVISPPPAARFPWDRAIAAIYSAGLLAFALRLAYGYLLARRLVRASRPLAQFGGEGVRESARIRVPLTVGFLRPAILLPAGWEAWDADRLHAVLVHERAHVQRADWAIALVAGANRCVFWFHPLAWWLVRQLGTLAEQACDDAALPQVSSRECYAGTLLAMAAAVRGEGRVMWDAMAMAKHGEVGMRVERILDEARRISPGMSRVRWCALALCGLPLVYPDRRGAPGASARAERGDSAGSRGNSGSARRGSGCTAVGAATAS
jgi:hypothetical protein